MFAILDIESTGGKFNKEGITEIAIYRFNGQEIVDQFSSLINPERPIQPFVVQLTGINNDMLRYAPKFYEVAKRIVEITEGCTLVAHNVNFDYRLLKVEFDRLGYPFKRDTLCTVELSKKLIPGLPSYSLGKLVRSLGIPLTDRHRAFGDALATVRLFQLLLEKDNRKNIIQNYTQTQLNPHTKRLLLNIVEDIPTKTGLYYIFNTDKEIIFLGKASNLKRRVNKHFTSKQPVSRQIRQEVAFVNYEVTGNQLIAELKEAEELRSLRPKYNTPTLENVFTHGLYRYKDRQGRLQLEIRAFQSARNLITPFKSKRQGEAFLEKITNQYQLNRPAETIAAHNRHITTIIQQYSIPQKNILLICPGRKPAEKSVIMIKEKKLKGYAYFDLNYQLSHPDMIEHLLTEMKDSRYARLLILHFMQQEHKILKKILF